MLTISTLTSRLAKDTSLNIGVIEAGGFVQPGQNSLVDTPGTLVPPSIYRLPTKSISQYISIHRCIVY
jgi:hypothetical protein